MKTSNCLNCKVTFNYNGSNYHGKYCSNKCQGEYRQKQYLINLKSGALNGKTINRPSVYAHLVRENGNRCAICLTEGIWNEKPLRLWVDHIDGNASNNTWTNFRLICPNCESQLDTCRAKNKGKGRKAIGMKW